MKSFLMTGKISGKHLCIIKGRELKRTLVKKDDAAGKKERGLEAENEEEKRALEGDAAGQGEEDESNFEAADGGKARGNGGEEKKKENGCIEDMSASDEEWISSVLGKVKEIGDKLKGALVRVGDGEGEIERLREKDK